MRVAAAIPALAVLAGSAAGLALPDVPRLIPAATMVVACATAVVVWRRDRALIASVVVGFAAGGEALSSDAWSRARSSTLRKAFDDAAVVEREDAVAERRFMPEDADVYAIVEGILRADASSSPAGVSLSLDVTRFASLAKSRRGGAGGDVSGGALVSVAGTLAPGRVDEWRAGRRVRLPVDLHRPSRYLDAGVPDGERALLLRGTALVGTTKSGALVEVVVTRTLERRPKQATHWSTRTMAEARGLNRISMRLCVFAPECSSL
jgi:hypothetical protein